MICCLQNLPTAKQVFDFHKTKKKKKEDTRSFSKRCLLKIYKKIILKIINLFFLSVPFDALEYISK